MKLKTCAGLYRHHLTQFMDSPSNSNEEWLSRRMLSFLIFPKRRCYEYDGEPRFDSSLERARRGAHENL